MIRIVLLAGAAAASVGVKKLRERKKQERASVDEGSGADSAVETSTTYQPTNGIAKEDSVESDAKKNVDEKANQRLGSGEAAVSAATLPASESPKTRISGSSVVPVESSPVAVFAAQTGERSNLAKASVSSPSVGRSRVSRLRLEIEGASQGDAFSFPDPGKGGSPGSIKAPPTPVTNGLSVRVADSDAGLAFSPPGETAAVALPSPVIAAVGANLPPTAAAAFVAPSTIDTVPPSLGGVNSSSSIRAPPTPSKELHSPYPETKPPLVISSGVRAVPIIPPRSRSRGPRVSVNAGLLDILPEDGTREGRVRAIPSKRPSVEPPLVRSSFTEGVFGALARSVPKGGLPFSSRSGPSSPVGSIRAPPTPLGLPKPLNPDSRGASPAPLVIRAVPTPGGAVKEEKTWEGVSLDGDSESVTSAGTNLDAASVVVSPIETESQRRVARERLSLKDRRVGSSYQLGTSWTARLERSIFLFTVVVEGEVPRPKVGASLLVRYRN